MLSRQVTGHHQQHPEHFLLTWLKKPVNLRGYRTLMPPPSSTKAKLKAAKAAIDAQKYSRAIEICNELLANDDQNYHAHVLYGVALSATGEHASAVQAYITATTLRPALPLAHKGIIDAVTPDDPVPEHRLALARAHLALPEPSLDGIQLASQLFYKLAQRDSGLVEEALRALQKAHEANIPGQKAWNESAAWRITHLILSQDPQDEKKDWEELGTGPLGLALNYLEEQLRESSIPICEDLVFDAVVSRIAWRASHDKDCKQHLDLLTEIGANEAVLELAEHDDVDELCDGDKVIHLAFRALHHAPHRHRMDRVAAIVAAELIRQGGNRDVVENLVGLKSVSGRNKGSDVEVPNTTVAIVKAFMHLQREENKIAVEVALAGEEMAKQLGNRERQRALLQLIAAAGLCGDRKYKDSVKLYEAARSYARNRGDAWIEAAANRGLVDTCILGHGRKARQTSTAIEEATGAVDNLYGVLESVWTDALADDVDSERMAELTERAVAKAKSGGEEDGVKRWELRALDSTFTMSSSELAAIASARLGQMLIQEYGVEKSVLERAQRCQMDAAGLFKGLPSPFAQLGWIFEKLAGHTETKKMYSRAIRCYERAVAIDPAHPVAGRRLARMLLERKLVEEAAEVARQASDFNPRARWAHNIVGWSLIAMNKFNEAAVSFRNAMRGRLKVSSKAEEALFGTDVGRTIEDNDLLVDVDSWRGLSCAYRGQGKFGPAVACVDDAISLLMKPPVVYITSALYDVPVLQKSVLAMLEAEKAMLEQAQKSESNALLSLESVLSQSNAPLAIKTYLSEALMFSAGKEWLAGCYQRATQIRARAARVMQEAISETCNNQPALNPASLLKRLGDTCMEVATLHPEALKKLVPAEHIEWSLDTALAAYCKAMHYEPWNWRLHGQDIASAMLRRATASGQSELAEHATRFLLGTQPDASILAMGFLAQSMLTCAEDIAKMANELASRVSTTTTSKRHRIALDASIAVHSSRIGEIAKGGESAISALRYDPMDWRGWYAVAIVREADAEQNEWHPDMLQSSADAFKEADRLGAGPVAVQGVVRCSLQLLRIGREQGTDAQELYKDACFCSSAASRVGLEEPSLCREVIDEHTNQTETQAKLRASELTVSGSPEDVYRHFHMYPFVPDVAKLTLVAPC